MKHPIKKGFPLWWAAEKGNAEITKLLLKAKAKVDNTGPDGETALLRASSNGNIAVMKILINAGANVNVSHKSNLGSPLYMASFYDKPEAVRLLLKHGANINYLNMTKDTPLYIACHQGHTEIVRMLLEAKADVSLRAHGTGPSVVMAATHPDKIEILKMLIAAGADVNLTGYKGYTALIDAVDQGRTYALVKILRTPAGEP